MYYEDNDPDQQKNILELILDAMPSPSHNSHIEESAEVFMSGIVIEIYRCKETGKDLALVLTNTNQHNWYDTLSLKLIDE